MRRPAWGTWATGVLGVIALTAVLVQAGRVMLAWDGSSGAHGYELHYGLSPGPYTVAVDTGLALTAVIDGLSTGETYVFAALAYNAVAESPYSNEVTAVARDPEAQDVTPPTVTITSPRAGATVPRNQELVITVQATDDRGVTVVEVSVDNQLIGVDDGEPWAVRWQVPAAPRRTYTIVAMAWDAAQNLGRSPSLEVISSDPGP
jgi:hypothetical protein